MVINEKEFPIVLQAYETAGDHDQFVAEQVVHNQTEADHFATRCSGLLIRATKLITDQRYAKHHGVKALSRPHHYSAAWIIVLLLLIGLVVAGFTTGWIQRTFDWPVR